jgi:alpha-D-ribose 1-methylphosphonate 5-triphosphate synthase subunit PhnG
VNYSEMNVTEPSTVLSELCCADAGRVKQRIERLLPLLGEISVIKNRTGIMMLPAIDPVQGTRFHVGEVLVSEAHVRLGAPLVDGYAVCVGRDLQQALAIAIADACLRAGVFVEEIRSFARAEAELRHAEDRDLLVRVAATRVEMETF